MTETEKATVRKMLDRYNVAIKGVGESEETKRATLKAAAIHLAGLHYVLTGNNIEAAMEQATRNVADALVGMHRAAAEGLLPNAA